MIGHPRSHRENSPIPHRRASSRDCSRKCLRTTPAAGWAGEGQKPREPRKRSRNTVRRPPVGCRPAGEPCNRTRPVDNRRRRTHRSWRWAIGSVGGLATTARGAKQGINQPRNDPGIGCRSGNRSPRTRQTPVESRVESISAISSQHPRVRCLFCGETGPGRRPGASKPFPWARPASYPVLPVLFEHLPNRLPEPVVRARFSSWKCHPGDPLSHGRLRAVRFLGPVLPSPGARALFRLRNRASAEPP
ncbi:MAG: hypothetical protein CM1200mP2_31160 [Planctomycetaceae bacterium]|nr:MAG: hypothetical protein CM1200mP2_31160 [Planctomycetaceae bacterium]